MTRSLGIWDRLSIKLSVMPSLRYSVFGSPPTFTNGNTAMESICEVLALERQYQITAAAMTMNKPTSRTGSTIFQSCPRPAAEPSATFTARDEGDEASAGEGPDAAAGGWASGGPLC